MSDLSKRQQAEARLAQQTTALAAENIAGLSRTAAQEMMHELRVHQIELEMQNEELRESQLALDLVRARYFELYDMAPVGYCTISEAGMVTEANLTAASLLGMPREALIGKPFSRLIVRADQDSYYLHRKKLLTNAKPVACELRMVKHGGSQIWVHLGATVGLDASGAPELRAVLSDISDRDRLYHELQEKNVAVESARAAADKANLAKSEFLSNMSHELRTPLGAILGFAQLMDSGTTALTSTQKRSIAQILKAGWYLLDLINEILDLALVESGKLSLSMEPVSLATVINECQTMTEAQAQTRGIRMTFPRFDEPCFVKADRTRVKQILINLLSNAIKYNKLGGTIAVECIQSASERLRISVRDSGAGLTGEQLANLFQPFNRLGQESTAVQGSGMGLVMAKRLIELMEGDIGVTSTVGKGSVFWIELNQTAAPQFAATTALATELVVAGLPTGAAPRTVLYVEDNPANLLLVEDLIARRSDIRLVSAVDGFAGIRMAIAIVPDMILMDINLPGMNGIQVREILAANPVTKHIPVVALSANAMPHDIQKGLEAGFFRYLTKPIRIAEFMQTLDVVLKHAETQALK